jgi:hypothetical protein
MSTIKDVFGIKFFRQQVFTSSLKRETTKYYYRQLYPDVQCPSGNLEVKSETGFVSKEKGINIETVLTGYSKPTEFPYEGKRPTAIGMQKC